MKKHMPSIRTQLLLWLVIPLLVLLSGGAALTYGVAVKFATEAYDKALLDSVYSVAACVKVLDNELVVDLPPPALAILLESMKDKVYYQVLDKRGRLIAGDNTIPPPSRSPVFREGESPDPKCADYRSSTIAGERVRIASMNYPLSEKPGESVIIQVAETLHSREQIVNQILIGIVLMELSMVVLVALVIWFGVSRGLAPLRSIRDAVASRTPFDLRPIDVISVPREVRPLVAAIDGLLIRLREDIEAQRRFIANAAHQLRTPIAGLKTQSELALRQRDPGDVHHALQLIYTGAERAGRLANQLLALARAEPGAVDPDLWQMVDLNGVARNASKELVSQALAKGIDISFEGTVEFALIKCDQASVNELTINLIENAVLYTQAGGQVTVRIYCDGTGAGLNNSAADTGGSYVTLMVEDNGPGIPLEERGLVFERFYRLSDRGGNGSGLGLSIVREIANAHGAKVTLADSSYGCGTSIAVAFPGAVLAQERRELLTVS